MKYYMEQNKLTVLKLGEKFKKIHSIIPFSWGLKNNKTKLHKYC